MFPYESQIVHFDYDKFIAFCKLLKTTTIQCIYSLIHDRDSLPHVDNELISDLMYYICVTAASATTSLPNGNCVYGVAMFKNQLYVGRSSSRDIAIYDVASLELQRYITVPGPSCINDMASRTGSDVMYVADKCSKSIHVIGEEGVRSRWSVSEKPIAISVLPFSSNVLVTFENKDYLHEYTPEGDLAATINLPEAIGVPMHAIKTP
jgi:hypothetical protein